MYHQLLLFRLLDCLNVTLHNQWHEDGLSELLKQKASLMISWLSEVTFANGTIPMVNDSAEAIAPSTSALVDYATRLGIHRQPVALSDSGYRMVRVGDSELFVDAGAIGPDYIPGHAHSDTLNFLLHASGIPIIVDTGTSTYERSARRQLERSTISHNTVEVSGRNQSEVWSSFRVGRRARIVEFSESPGMLIAAHDGYRKLGILHRRAWSWSQGEIMVTDELVGSDAHAGTGSIHFHPDVQPTQRNDVVVAGPVSIFVPPNSKLENYEFADGFNRTRPARVVRYPVKGKTQILLRFN
jgi:uncharacterized heparinase superfamily protein